MYGDSYDDRSSALPFLSISFSVVHFQCKIALSVSFILSFSLREIYLHLRILPTINLSVFIRWFFFFLQTCFYPFKNVIILFLIGPVVDLRQKKNQPTTMKNHTKIAILFPIVFLFGTYCSKINSNEILSCVCSVDEEEYCLKSIALAYDKKTKIFRCYCTMHTTRLK